MLTTEERRRERLVELMDENEVLRSELDASYDFMCSVEELAWVMGQSNSTDSSRDVAARLLDLLKDARKNMEDK